MSDQPGLLREGFQRVWYYQRVVWWMFFVNLFFAVIGGWPFAERMRQIADHSLHSKRLVDVFDVSAFSALSSNPDLDVFSGHGSSIHYSFVFFFFALFLTGGILEVYRSGRRLTTREFFEASGSYFWRFVRLLVIMGVVLAPILIAFSTVANQAGSLMGNPIQEKSGFWLLVGAVIVCGLMMMCIRLWFDMAQVRSIVEEETRMLHNSGQAFKLTFGNFASLFWMYLRISLLGWLIFALGFYMWTKMPPARFGLTFLMLELVILFGFGIRLWQKACEMIWYQRRFLARVVALPPPPPAPDPLLTITPAPVSPSQI